MIETWTPRVGVEAACRAFGTSPADLSSPPTSRAKAASRRGRHGRNPSGELRLPRRGGSATMNAPGSEDGVVFGAVL